MSFNRKRLSQYNYTVKKHTTLFFCFASVYIHKKWQQKIFYRACSLPEGSLLKSKGICHCKWWNPTREECGLAWQNICLCQHSAKWNKAPLVWSRQLNSALCHHLPLTAGHACRACLLLPDTAERLQISVQVCLCNSSALGLHTKSMHSATNALPSLAANR